MSDTKNITKSKKDNMKEADKKLSGSDCSGATQECQKKMAFSARLAEVVKKVNPKKGTINCGNIIDAVADRLTGYNPEATAPKEQDGSFSDIEKRFDTKIKWGSNFKDAFEAVKKGGDGTMAVIGIGYSDQKTSHVVIMANDGGAVGIVEAQGKGEVIKTSDRADKLYNSDGGSNIGFGLFGKRNR